MARRLIAIAQVSLDGIMQAPGAPEEDPSGGFTQGGWAMPFFDAAGMQEVHETIAGEFDLLLGRRTYDIWAAYWPHQDDAIGRAFNKATKHVVTHRGGLTWADSKAIHGDLAVRVRDLKDANGPPLHVWGSTEILHQLMAANLLDELRLWVFPVVLGSGKRLFAGPPPRRFSLLSSRATPTGVLLNAYA